jgi:hypothetical protein
MALEQSLSVTNETGLSLNMGTRGRFEIADRKRSWTFSGPVGGPLVDLSAGRGRDRAGSFREISFAFAGPKRAARRGAIKLYDRREVVLFQQEFIDPGTTAEVFPSLSQYPPKLHHLTYTGIFGGFSFSRFGADGPWAFFDDRGNAFIISAASHFMNGFLSRGSRGQLRCGIVANTQQIPAGFVATAVLAMASGVNQAFENWGRFLTDLAGKKRPANDADIGLKYLGYWTDHGAHYYYRTAPGLDYVGTLLKVRDEFGAANQRLGYLQLDSWFYPKGRRGDWHTVRDGTYLYEAAPKLFPDGLRAFQKKLGLPLITHNRWLDRQSPYRKKFAISGNVAVDPALWRRWMRYLHASGVRIYEQDWLSGPAQPQRTLDAGDRFMDLMANAAGDEGMSMQYCMPLPRHFLQSSKYSNLTTIRPSGDRLKEQHWRSFLFNGRLATALGVWPWTDVFKSSETANLLLATLSGGMVGIGDAIGKIDWNSLRRAVRADGVLVKPDKPLTPLDQSYIACAKDPSAPIVAVARTDHEGWITSYLFAFGGKTVTVSPAALGYEGPVYAYDYFRRSGAYLMPKGRLRLSPVGRTAYFIVVPVAVSGIGLLGDLDKFVSNGRSRVRRIVDSDALRAEIVVAAGESRVRLHGFSRSQPLLDAKAGSIENLVYDSRRRLFQFDLIARPRAAATITARTSHQESGEPAQG